MYMLDMRGQVLPTYTIPHFAPPATQVYHKNVGIQEGAPLHMGVRLFSHLIYTMSTQLEGATTCRDYKTWHDNADKN